MDVLVRSLNAALMILLPLGALFLLARRWRLGWRLALAGGATFLAAQALHLPFNRMALAALFEATGIGDHPQGLQLGLVATSLGLSAGIFEESARVLVLRYGLREARGWREGVIFGLGHGGVEALILGLLALFGLLQAMALRGAALEEILPADHLAAAQDQLAAYWEAPWHAVLLGALERAFSMALHVALSLLVMQVFLRGRWRWFAAATLWHAAVDAVVVFASGVWGPYWAEALVALLAAISLAMVFALRDRPQGVEEGENAHAQLTGPPLVRASPNASRPSLERLEETRYDEG